MSLSSARVRAVTSRRFARRNLGLKTAIVEKDKELGGTCLNVGCIPSKALLTSSDHYVFAKKEAAKHGIVMENIGLDLAKMLARKDKVVKTMNGGVKALMKGNKITTFQGLGTVTAPGRVAIKPDEGESQEIEASAHRYRDRQRAGRVSEHEVRRRRDREQHRGAYL